MQAFPRRHSPHRLYFRAPACIVYRASLPVGIAPQWSGAHGGISVLDAVRGRGHWLHTDGVAFVKIPIKVEPANGAAANVEYRWDPDTEILSAQLKQTQSGPGMSGSVEVEGADGSWLIFEVSSGRIQGVEVAVWPDVQMRATLQPPASVEDGQIVVPSRKSQPGIASLEVETPLIAEADQSESVFHFMLGRQSRTRTIRFAKDLLLDVDSSNNLAGLWMLNVPPFKAGVG